MQLDPVAYREADLLGKAPEVIVETMIYGDEVDDFAVALPEGMWDCDSMILYQVAADDIEATAHPGLSASLGRVITNQEHANDYRLEGETIMLSVSPTTARVIVEGFRTFTGELTHDDDEITESDVRGYFSQWIALLEWAAGQRMSLVFHVG